MFRLEHSEFLWYLLIIPGLILLFILLLQFRKSRMKRFAEFGALKRLVPDISKYKHILKFALFLLGLSFLILAWANPQWGSKREKVERKSADVIVALDISASMDSEDIKPTRIERAKRFAQNLVEELKGERIGTIIFAGNAYLQMPLTTDYAAAKLFINATNTRMAASQGTAITEAMELAETSFGIEEKYHKALILITDGENHEEEALNKAAEVYENGMVIFTIGVGTPEGGYIPVKTVQGIQYKRNQDGSLVQSKLNERLLIDISDRAGGEYFHITEGQQVINTIKQKIDNLDKREFEQRTFREYNSYFQYFIGIGIIFLLIEFLLHNRKNKWFNRKSLDKA